MNEAMQKSLEDQDSLLKQTKMLRSIGEQISPAARALAAFRQNSGMARALEEAQRFHDSLRAALGPVEDLRRLGRLSDEITAACEAFSGLESRFSFPATVRGP